MGMGGDIQSQASYDNTTRWDDGLTTDDDLNQQGGATNLSANAPIEDKIFPNNDQIIYKFVNFFADLRITIELFDHEQADTVFATCVIHKEAFSLPYFVRFTGFPPSQDGSDTHLRDFQSRITTENLDNSRSIGSYAILAPR